MRSSLLSRFCLLGVLTLPVASCDPNVVIGAKWALDEPAAGKPPATGGSTGAGAGGSEPIEAGAPPLSEGGTGTGAGGAAGGEAGGGGEGGDDGGGAPIFEATHEDGSLAEWDLGPDQDAGGYYADQGLPSYSEEQARSGRGSAKTVIDTSDGTAPIARLYRRIEHEQAYYSSWFYLLEDHTPSVWWSIFLFRAVRDRNRSIDLWSVNLIRENDRLTLSLFDHPRGNVVSVPSKPTVPVGEWFQLEAFLDYAEGRPSRLDLWFNGELVLSLPDLTEAPAAEPAYWVVGNGASLLAPPVSTLYVDDAVVSATRVGP